METIEKAYAKITCFDIADFFISFSNCTGSLISNLKLQKLVFYAQAWNLAVNKVPLFNEEFEAWIHGPVIPELYDIYKENKWHPIIRDDLNETKFVEIKTLLDNKTNEILQDVITEYFPMDAYALEKSTHLEEPWIAARKGIPQDEPCRNVIDKDSIMKFYSQFVVLNG
jgi:uncharacterized phage-associated protein